MNNNKRYFNKGRKGRKKVRKEVEKFVINQEIGRGGKEIGKGIRGMIKRRGSKECIIKKNLKNIWEK